MFLRNVIEVFQACFKNRQHLRLDSISDNYCWNRINYETIRYRYDRGGKYPFIPDIFPAKINQLAALAKPREEILMLFSVLRMEEHLKMLSSGRIR